jgi:Flp pilus assembly protein TadD
MHAAARAIRDGATAQAQSLLAQVLADAPHHPEALRLLAILHTRLRRHAEAIDALQRALAQRPEDAFLHSDLGNARMACGDATAAFDSWRRACALAPEQPMPWFNLGRNLQLHGSSEAAIEALQQASALAPELLPASLLLADALVHLGRFEEAASRYRAVLARQIRSAGSDAFRGRGARRIFPTRRTR